MSTVAGETAGASSSTWSATPGHQGTAQDMACAHAALPTVPVALPTTQVRERALMDLTQPVPLLDGAGRRSSAGPLSRRRSQSPQRVRSQSPVPVLRSSSPPRQMAVPTGPGFSNETCGLNLEISGDRLRAVRTRGCRQAAAVGANPLPLQRLGRYFEVVVEETVAGWVGGLGIGVTATPPEQVRRVPDKAWRMPNTFIVGYWGCIFLDGVERRNSWHPASLNSGARVGLLVSEEGDLLVFVDERPVVRA